MNVRSSGRSAKEIFEFIKETLDENKISFDGMMSQSFDGASVMSGEHGGLQAIICQYCGRCVVYIHCFCHRLHLSIKAVMDGVEELVDHLSIVCALYDFFKLSAVKEDYSGDSLKRLIATRWSGHLRSCKLIKDNYPEVVRTLDSARTNKKLKVADRAKASGLFAQAISREFIFFNYFVCDVLVDCDIACKILQSSRENLNSAMQSIASVREDLQDKRDDYTKEKVELIIQDARDSRVDSGEEEEGVKRVRKQPRMEDFLITERLPGNKQENLHQVAIKCLDFLEQDFARRFSEQNTKLWLSMESLLPTSSSFLDEKQLEPFYSYCINIPAVRNMLRSKDVTKQNFEGECRVFKRVIKAETSNFYNERQTIDLGKVCTFVMKKLGDKAPTLTVMYRVATTAGFASARCESLFSSLPQVDRT